MLGIIGHIFFAIFGIKALASGKVALNKQSEVTGLPARLMGVFALMTFPLAFVLGIIFGIYWGIAHQGEAFPTLLAVVLEFAAFLIVGVAIFLIYRGASKDAPQTDPAPDSQPPSAPAQ